MRIDIWDNGGRTFDRYMVVIGWDIYTMSHNPRSPQGVNQSGGQVRGAAASPPKLWGNKVPFGKLPDEVQIAIAERIIGTTGEHLT